MWTQVHPVDGPHSLTPSLTTTHTPLHPYLYFYPQVHPVDGPHSVLLGSHQEAQRFLGPALMLLYGDVEKTGHYDKIENRRYIMVSDGL